MWAWKFSTKFLSLHQQSGVYAGKSGELGLSHDLHTEAYNTLQVQVQVKVQVVSFSKLKYNSNYIFQVQVITITQATYIFENK